MPSDWIVPFIDLGAVNARYMPEMLTAASRIINSGHYVMGPELEAFEAECAAYLGVKHAIGVNSGTDALQLAIEAVDRLGDALSWVVPAMTFVATAAAVHHATSPFHFMDIDAKTGMIPGDCYKPIANEFGITIEGQAVIPVHLYGAPQPGIDQLKADFRWLIEDAAEAFGASYPDGRKVGAIGEAGCFSFVPTKNLGGFGDGGLVVTNSDDVADHVRLLRNHGRSSWTEHSVVGYNSRLDEIQAAWLRIKLRDIDLRNRQRALIAQRYRDEFGAMNYLCDHALVEWPAFEGTHVYQVCVCLLPPDQRDRVYAELREGGVDAKIHYPVCVPDQPAFSGPYGRLDSSFPNARLWAKRCLTLPCWPDMTDEQIQHVVDSMREAICCG